jgi:hypothetical protein
MNIELVVVQPFAGRARGEVITDPAAIERVMASNAAHVVARRAPAPAAPASVEGN